MAEIASNRKPTLWAIFYFFAALGAGGAAFFGAAVGVSTTLSSTTTPHVAGIQVEQVFCGGPLACQQQGRHEQPRYLAPCRGKAHSSGHIPDAIGTTGRPSSS